MPTGYTYLIVDGDGITPRQFLLGCARAFGAAIMQREDPVDAPLKTVVEPSSYHGEALAEEELRLGELQLMGAGDIVEMASTALLAAQAYRKEQVSKHVLETKRYKEMLAAVRQWEPPTDEHEGLKAFAIEQIQMSIDTYAIPPVDESVYEPAAWHAAEVAHATKAIERGTQDVADDVAQCKKKTEWLTVFVESLPEDES